MAEMTAAEAVKLLHNNQYQKHIGNGEYDYIHPLTDAQAKGIESLIEQQAAEIERLKVENNRLRVCGNCRHFSTGYTESYCVKETCCGECETLRQNTCRDWEMV